jgi:hypothetical protein
MSLSSLIIKMLQAEDKGRDCEDGKSGREARGPEKRSELGGKQRENERNANTAPDIDELDQVLDRRLVPILVLDKEAVATHVAHEVKEGRGDHKCRRQTQLLWTEKPGHRNVPHQGCGLGNQRRYKIDFGPLSPVPGEWGTKWYLTFR